MRKKYFFEFLKEKKNLRKGWRRKGRWRTCHMSQAKQCAGASCLLRSHSALLPFPPTPLPPPLSPRPRCANAVLPGQGRGKARARWCGIMYSCGVVRGVAPRRRGWCPPYKQKPRGLPKTAQSPEPSALSAERPFLSHKQTSAATCARGRAGKALGVVRCSQNLLK